MADILIRGTHFPRNGHRVFRIYADGRVEGEYTGIPLGAAIELPEHGNLIDRDALPKERVEWEDIVNAPVVIPANKEETE